MKSNNTSYLPDLTAVRRPQGGFFRLLLTANCLLVLLVGCAASPSRQPGTEANAQCYEVFRRVDSAIAAAGVADGMAARVEGFPYLRASRFLASYAREELSDAQFADWMNRMIELGRQAHAIELANLATDKAEELGHELWDVGRSHAWTAPALADCTSRLAAADYADPDRRAALRTAVHVPDDYVPWQRVAGLYWLTRIPFASGIDRWHQEVRGTFALCAGMPVCSKQTRASEATPLRISSLDGSAKQSRM